MTVYDNSYSRFVAWAKILLPLFALGVLSTLFLFSKQIDPTRAIPFSKVDVKELAREERIGSPNYSGVTQDGAAISIAASNAKPDPENPQRMIASNLVAKIEMPDGGLVDISARDGEIDSAGQIARLEGGVDIQTSSGYRIRTAALTALLDKTDIKSDDQVTAKGPIGTLEAGLMEINQAPDGETNYVLVFKNGVKLVYDPEK